MREGIYRGRFAPSPTGSLHFGSLIAAVGSFLDARAQQGEWLLRMEDIDPPREVKGAAEHILLTLEQLGLHWDQAPLYQSSRSEAYREVLQTLTQQGKLYPCTCSRKKIQSIAACSKAGYIYPGTCRDGTAENVEIRSYRLSVEELKIHCHDRLQGNIQESLADQVGDFILQRGNGLFAYHLAVVVDDAEQGISDIVRGADLLDSTCRQIYLQRTLGYPTPQYLHLPMATGRDGCKLSKQTFAPAIDTRQALQSLSAALRFLGQDVAAEADIEHLDDFWRYAIQHWKPENIPRQRSIPVN